MFYSKVNSAVFQSINELRKEGLETDKITAKDQAKTTVRSMNEKAKKIKKWVKEHEGITESSLSDDYFKELLKEAAFSTNVMSYCNIIRKKYILREAIKVSFNVINDCKIGEKEEEEICNIAQDEFYKLSTKKNQDSYKMAYEYAPAIFDDIENAMKTSDGITGIKTSYKAIDVLTGGLQRTDMIVLAGRPGMGKTTFALNLAYNICCKSNMSVAFFSLEMSGKQLVKKIISGLSGVVINDMRTGFINEERMNDLYESVRQLYKKRFYIDDDPYLTISSLRNKCMKIQRKKGLDIVFIDYLQLMHAGTNYENSANTKKGFNTRQEELAEISRNIKGLAKDLDIPIIALSQLSREVESRKEEIPQLSDLRESGAIEQDADIVILLGKPRETDPEGSVNVNFAKHRNGDTRVLNFKFDKATSSFKEWDNT